MFRSHTCGELGKTDVGKQVTLSGWVNTRRDHGGLIFIDLRDRYGLTQVVFDSEKYPPAWAVAEKLRDEFVIRIEGVVTGRPPEMVNPHLPTGSIEVRVSGVEVLNSSKTPPFEVSYLPAEGDTSTQTVNEELRLKYRFIDLRRRRMLENLEFRSRLTLFIRQWMVKNGFIEVETPILTVSSPEGARDFLVPSRLHPGKFYALPQAPQQYKQLLMVGGIDRYFQIAPCLRDEDARADRSPGEFYQLDVETSFMTQEEFFTLMEPLFIELTETLTKKKILRKPFPRIPFAQAMAKYGTDKPDIRFGLEIQDVTSMVAECGFSVFSEAVNSGGVVRAIVATGAAGMSRSQIDELTEVARKNKAKGLAYIVVKEDELSSPIIKFLGEELALELVKELNAKPGDTIFFGAADKAIVAASLGAVRAELGKRLDLIDSTMMAYCWIVDFPMFEYNEQEKKVDFCHNPFSLPQGGLEALNTQDPLTILAYQYDIVCNGVELSSGAVRNVTPDIMYRAFEIAGYTREQVDAKFGHMIRSFEFGAPPECGFAPGIERMAMLLRDEPNIREITAFPKNGRAEDVMMGAPSEVDAQQLKELHIKVAHD
ncbi:aspartate--tRNA ligase [Candidatus Uhrbacteria bacterium]|nr:aspartate--tRNA ligase [Candidatus Uhrbacteria bacterium]